MSTALEKHYRVRELASLWGFSDNSIVKLFAAEPGVIRLESKSGRRKYTTLSIPESVALRVHERLGNQPLQTRPAASNALRMLRVRDLHTGVGKSRSAVRLKTA